MGLYFTDSSFNELQLNPFNHNKRYDCGWIMLKLLDSASFKQYTGGGTNGIFQLIITKKNIDWEYRIFDFIQYEMACGHNIILAVNQEDYETAQKTYARHSYMDNFLRFYEKKILVHTTTKESYQAIKLDCCLKSWNILQQEKALNEDKPIGALLGDPMNYSDYIMFSNGGYSAERVISSKQKGYIEMDVDKPYTAGARLYFDCGKIAQDGLLVRDGAHLKVKQCLPLEEYLLWAATPGELGISEETTPRIFAEKADIMFEEMFKINL
jgi:hypothetical protein